MKRKILTLLLALGIASSWLTAGASAAAGSSFPDVYDSETALAVESLRLMDAMGGYPDGTFRPGAALTRAQFCKMIVYVMNASVDLGKYRAVTVFPDVRPSHWAAPYINLASKGKQVIGGFGDGKFHPDETVTAGQAVTISMRMLGYQDTDVSAVWPDGYIAQAGAIGLLDGLELDASAPLTRGQAARLLVNLLRSPLKEGGKSYGESIAASAQTHVMLVSSAATGNDGKQTAMEIGGSGQIYQMAYKTSTGLLNGRMGTLLLDKSGKVLTFVPDIAGTTRSAVVSEAAAGRLTVTSGEIYSMGGTVKAHYQGKETTWDQVYLSLRPGTALTLYLNSGGGVEYIFVGGGDAASDDAVVVYKRGSTEGLSALTGGAYAYSYVKNGAQATAADLRPYDVVTYSSATNTLRVCDTRLTGIYEDCYPNPTAPTRLTLMGHEFEVLECARDMVRRLKIGSAVTLLLTEDNRIAGALDAESSGVRGNAVGICKGGSVELLCGITLTGVSSDASGLVSVSSSQRGKVGVTALNGGPIGAFDTLNRKVGTRSLAENALVFTSGPEGLEAVSPSQLTTAVIAGDQVRYVRTNWADKVDIVVLGSRVTASQYILGRAKAYTEGSKNYVELELIGGGKSGPYITSYQIRGGSYVQVELNADRTRVMAVETLEKLSGVPDSAWQGADMVHVSGKFYNVAGDLMCWNKATQAWVTPSQGRAFSKTCDLYLDEKGTVRVMEVQQ